MPGTTRYSATFDRTYEESDRPDPEPPLNARRSRSLSWQANSGLDGRPYTPLGGKAPTQRSSSTDNGPSKGAEHIPTRTVTKTPVKAHNNPFQFVAVGTCPLYKKAEEQLKKVKEVKKKDVLKEEEEEWQSNLDSWKSRRRKMSEDVFRRQEEIKQFLEQEEQVAQVAQKKTKTFSEMVESRAQRGRALSLCLLTSPLELQNWEVEHRSHKNGSNSTFSGESEENSTVNSEDEGVSLKDLLAKSRNDSINGNFGTSENDDTLNNDSNHNTNGDYKLSDIPSNKLLIKSKEGLYIDSGLESISSSHRAGDTPDSCSDFSQDSGSSIDCESPRTGVNVLEDFSSKIQKSTGDEIRMKFKLNKMCKNVDVSTLHREENHVTVESIMEYIEIDSSKVSLSDQILKINNQDIISKKFPSVISILQSAVDKGHVDVLLWRHSKSSNQNRDLHPYEKEQKLQNENKSTSENGLSNGKYEKSIESENEMYVDDFEELQRQAVFSQNAKSNGDCQESKEDKTVFESDNTTSLSSSKCNGVTNIPVVECADSTSKEIKTETKKAQTKKFRKKGIGFLTVSSTPPQISKGATSLSLFPLSPVTELPSPADETKSVASSILSSVDSDSKEIKSNGFESNVSDCKDATVSLTNGETVLKSESMNVSEMQDSLKDDATAVACSKTEKTNERENKTSNESSQPSKPKTIIKRKIKVKKEDKATANISSADIKTIAEKPVPSVSNDKEYNVTCTQISDMSTLKENLGDIALEKVVKTATNQKKLKTKKKNTSSQKGNSSSKAEEPITNESLNVIFQSKPKETNLSNSNLSNYENNNLQQSPKVDDVPPVEQIAEEMERLILQQLEEEERAKELVAEMQGKLMDGSPDHFLMAPPRHAEPPKEKPPPPPSLNENPQKDKSLKRVNSTKRIKKEIYKRRSNFLGIENPDEAADCSEPSIPPPPALKEILKAEMELDRLSRMQIETAAMKRLTMEENEILWKEKEIIENLESEERRKQLCGISDALNEEIGDFNKIQCLKNERKSLELEQQQIQDQMRLIEEQQLREREEFIRKQEDKSPLSPSDPLLSTAANNPSQTLSPSLPLSSDTSVVSFSADSGDGINLTSAPAHELTANKLQADAKVGKIKPVVPPKPLKKKEAIRKERERLRQEQEALQREREEHRRKLLSEQEEVLKHQKPHAPDASASRLDPLPSLIKPQLTPSTSSPPKATSRNNHGAQGVPASKSSAPELMGPPVVRRKPPPRGNAVQNEAWGQQKVPSVWKQNHDSLPESRYNQNHWLIQEAEMRRITELKERQRAAQLSSSQPHLAEDEACSNPPRVPAIPSAHSQHPNYVAESVWNYGQSNLPVKKYPPPTVKEQLHTIYPRDALSQQPPAKPSRVVPMERQEQMLSVSGRKRCSHCNEELGRGAAMIIESLQLYYHIHCFQCCVCQAQLGNGSCGTDVRVRNNKLHCHNCYSNDEAGLKFSQV